MVEGSIGDSTGSKWKESWLGGLLPLIFLLFLVFPMLFLLQMNGMIIFLYLESIKRTTLLIISESFMNSCIKWEIHQEDVLMKMFMFSLAGDAREWYHSLPPASISSLGEFHAAFNAHCQKFYPSELICHSCCKGYNDVFKIELLPTQAVRMSLMTWIRNQSFLIPVRLHQRKAMRMKVARRKEML
jgi:hypothetical protein